MRSQQPADLGHRGHGDVGAAAQEAPVNEALFHDGVGAYQLTLDGYATDGLDQLADYLFATGTLSEVPPIPYLELPSDPDDDEEDEDA